MTLRTLIETWRHDVVKAGCIDGDTEKPCKGIQRCADDLETALPAPSTFTGLVSRRPSDGAIFIGGIEFTDAQAQRIARALLELLPAASGPGETVVGK